MKGNAMKGSGPKDAVPKNTIPKNTVLNDTMPKDSLASVAEAAMGLLEAVRFASEKHRDHRRKGNTAAPYINHPIAVADQLAANGCAEDTGLLMAAILHDVVEDTDTTHEELVEIFGERVAGIVKEVTDDKSLSSREIKEAAVRAIAGKSREARLLKLSDLIANITDLIHHPPNWTVERRRAYVGWAETVVAGLQGTHAGLEAHFAQLAGEARASLDGGD